MVFPVGPVRFGRPAFLPPAELRVLPFDALRSSLPTRNPAQAGAALVRAQLNANTPGYTPPVLMPQHMVQSSHKRRMGGVNRGAMKARGPSGQSFMATIAYEEARRAAFANQIIPPRVQTVVVTAGQFVDNRGANTLRRLPGALPQQGPARTRPAMLPAPPQAMTQRFNLDDFVRQKQRAAVVSERVRATAQVERVMFGAQIRGRQ